MSIPAGSIDLDLAFQTGDDLPPNLLAETGGLAEAQALVDPLAGSGAWADLLSHWLSQLQAELPPPLQAGAYCLGLSLVSDAEIAALGGATAAGIPAAVSSGLKLNAISASGANVVITWAGAAGVKLQSSATLGGVWADVTGSDGASTATIPAGNAAAFFRLVK